MHQPIKYRSDIDGLRALAVLSVVFYHAEWWPFTGGYVGVDIFFVISGYLITTIISKEVEERRFSFLEFYERRIRRIIPALFAVLFFCSFFVWLLFRNELLDFSKNIIGITLFSSNFTLWINSGGYFDGPEQLRPLLHTWSLSVEEQFYILFPPFLLLIYSLSLKIREGFFKNFLFRVALYGVMLSSFGFSAATAIFDTGVRTAFFLLPFRAWEMSLGAVLALCPPPALHSHKIKNGLAVLGLFFILIAIFYYNHDTAFPGYAALLPCLGAGLIIYANDGHRLTLVGRLLSLQILVFIGLISYSLYLWHWPLFAFIRIVNLGNLPLFSSFLAVILSFVLAFVSWRYIERPFRGKSGLFTRRQLFVLTAGACAFFIALGCYGVWGSVEHKNSPLINILYSSDERKVVEMKEDGANALDWGNNLFNRKIRTLNSERFVQCLDSFHPKYALIGDSHAMYATERTLFEMSGGHKANFCSGIPSGRWPLPGLILEEEDFSPVINKVVEEKGIKTVILSNRYAWDLYGGTPQDMGPAEVGIRANPLMEHATGLAVSPEDTLLREKMFEKYFLKLMKILLDAGKRVVLIYPVPEVGYDVPKELIKRLEKGDDVNGFLRPMDYFWKRNGFIIAVMDSLGDHPNLIRIKPHKVLCDGTWCKTAVDGKPLYVDDDHLSQAGVNLLRSQFEAVFKDPKWN